MRAGIRLSDRRQHRGIGWWWVFPEDEGELPGVRGELRGSGVSYLGIGMDDRKKPVRGIGDGSE
jgi:hypothetical protein